MSREIFRVPLDFDYPLNKVWFGYLMPKRLHENPCPDCKNGHSEHAEFLWAIWYGNEPFHPISTGSTRLTAETPAVRAFAERNVNQSPDLYWGGDEGAIVREAQRLASMWNGQWCHHLNQDDVDALIAAGRLMDFTHTWSRETGWQPVVPTPTVTAVEVNEWSLRTSGHDDLNASAVIRARCKQDDMPYECATCGGEATIEAYPGQRAEAEAWEPTEPPTGEGWQLWTTVNEGAPISPVFATAEELAGWMSDPGRGRDWVPFDAAMKFIGEGWAPSGMETSSAGFVSGVEYVGFHADGER